MWNEEKQRLFDDLRAKEYAGTLTAEEQEQLKQFFAELDAEETELLRPAMERYDREIAALQSAVEEAETRNTELAALAVRQRALQEKARAQIAVLLSEQAVISAEYKRITGQTLGGNQSAI